MGLEKALQGALSDTPSDKRGTERTALLVGANGRLGEAVLAALSGYVDLYSTLNVLTVAPIDMGIARLKAVREDAVQPIDDLILNITDEVEAFGQSYYGRDAAFKAISPSEISGWVSRIEALRIKRVCIIRPASAFSQMGGVGSTLGDQYEFDAHASRAETLLVFRPTPLVEPNQAKTWGQKLFGGYLSLNRFTLPKTFEPLRTADTAWLVAHELAIAQPGTAVFPADRMRTKLEAIKQNHPK
jgi:hypothetical protein